MRGASEQQRVIRRRPGAAFADRLILRGPKSERQAQEVADTLRAGSNDSTIWRQLFDGLEGRNAEVLARPLQQILLRGFVDRSLGDGQPGGVAWFCDYWLTDFLQLYERPSERNSGQLLSIRSTLHLRDDADSRRTLCDLPTSGMHTVAGLPRGSWSASRVKRPELMPPRQPMRRLCQHCEALGGQLPAAQEWWPVSPLETEQIERVAEAAIRAVITVIGSSAELGGEELHWAARQAGRTEIFRLAAERVSQQMTVAELVERFPFPKECDPPTRMPSQEQLIAALSSLQITWPSPTLYPALRAKVGRQLAQLK